jgi:signal peptidase II
VKLNKILTRGRVALLIAVLLILIDQVIKIWVKTHMTLDESIDITSWFKIHFIENNGMAYGMEFGSKYLLTICRIIAVCCIVFYIHLISKQKARWSYIITLSVIVAGAAGNIFDCMFYGLIFNGSSPFYVSYFVPFGHGYSSFLTGRVVDMFYCPLIVTTYPAWVPHFGGQEFIFFSPIFNFADACISVGIVILLLFFSKDLSTISETFSKLKKGGK